MSYNKTTWVDGETPLSAQNMNKIENQLEQNTNDIVGIIESGSNENGNWIKYADGTMICYGDRTFNMILNSEWGNVFETGEVYDFGNYPQTFIAMPQTHLTQKEGPTCWAERLQFGSTTAIGRTWFMRPATTTAEVVWSYLAIGRWK